MDTAMPCGLLVNEIVSNAYKYAFPGGTAGQIRIDLQKLNGKMKLQVSDNGSGLPSDFELEKSDSLGMQLIQALTSQLDGELKVSIENGTAFEVTFPYPKNAGGKIAETETKNS
jgi:two-component sensor histidine kinase